MRRKRRFPLFSLLMVMGLGFGVAYLTYIDVDTPRKALQQVGAAMSQFFGGIQIIGPSRADEAFTFADVPADQSATHAGGTGTDAPTPMLVNGDNPVAGDYMPGDLVRMRQYCDEDVVYIKGSEIDGVREAVDALMVMLRAALQDGVKNWQISAGYRSVSYQQKVWDNKVSEYRQQGLSASSAQTATAKYVAKPGCSEHHTGLAFDVTVPGESFPLTAQSKWLAEHCWDYGFIIRYAEDKQPITGINAEPWHVRYVGQPHARIMRDNNWCLEEYIASLRQQ